MSTLPIFPWIAYHEEKVRGLFVGRGIREKYSILSSWRNNLPTGVICVKLYTKISLRGFWIAASLIPVFIASGFFEKVIAGDAKTGKSGGTATGDLVIERDPNVGLAKAATSKRSLLIIIVHPEMPGCKLFEQTILSQPSVRSFLAENFVVARIEASSQLAGMLHQRLSLAGLPAFVLMASDKSIKGSTVGMPPSPAAFIGAIKNLAAGIATSKKP